MLAVFPIIPLILVTQSALDFLTAKNSTLHLMRRQVEGLNNIKNLCVKKCTYNPDIIKKMEELYRSVRLFQLEISFLNKIIWEFRNFNYSPVNAANCQPLCTAVGIGGAAEDRPEKKKKEPKSKNENMTTCRGSPNVEEETGLVKMAPPNVGVEK